MERMRGMPTETHHSTLWKSICQMTDPASFETLVRQVLCSLDPDFNAIIPTGTGEHGKPVRDPVDGIGYTWNAPSGTWLAMEATTQTGRALPKKLVSDLEKMLKMAPSEKRGRTKLVLACTSRVSSKLFGELHSRAEREG